MIKRNTAIFIFLSIVAILLLIISKDTHPAVFVPNRLQSIRYTSQILPWFKNFDECFDKQSHRLTGDLETMWVQVDKVISDCDLLFQEKLKASNYKNHDEVKRHLLPIMSTEKSTIITIGIGRDTDAEIKLRKDLGSENVEFFGADPIKNFNEELYKKIGQYYPYAVGAKSGNSTASVLEGGTYHDKTVYHMEIIHFLKNIVQRTFIDDLWLDAEYAEYDMLTFFHKGEKFDQNGITFCQINIEIHAPSTEQKVLLKEFIFRLQKEKRYAMLRTVNVGHLRLYLVNLFDERCIEKYVLGIN